VVGGRVGTIVGVGEGEGEGEASVGEGEASVGEGETSVGAGAGERIGSDVGGAGTST